MLDKLSFKDLDFRKKKVLIRVDFNVPLDEKQDIVDDSRIKAALPTIQKVIEQGGAAILISHLGRPKGKSHPTLSLAPVAKRLEKLIGSPVKFASDCIGKEVEELARNLKPKEILLLENLRFHPGEESPEKEPQFASQLASLGDLFINDAFGTSHRAHASTTKIASFFSKNAAFGALLEKEINYLGATLKNPKRPFLALIGGAKVSSKLGVLKALVDKADILLIGGAMAFTFLKAQQKQIGDSLFEEALLPDALAIIQKCQEKKIPLLFPVDLVAAKSIDEKAEKKVVSVEEGISDGWRGVDIGPRTCELFKTHCQKASTIFWNGPMGIFEIAPFSSGTYEMARIISSLDHTTTIVGGGDSVSAIVQSGLEEKFSHLSTGGGAALEYVELGTLPGIEALSDAS